MAYAVTQQALGAIMFASTVTGSPEAMVAADGGNCLPPAFRAASVKDHVRRHLWCALPLARQLYLLLLHFVLAFCANKE
jgi:hypothetical protein